MRRHWDRFPAEWAPPHRPPGIEWDKTYLNPLYGKCCPERDFPRLFGLYQSGRLLLDELVSGLSAQDIDELAALIKQLRARMCVAVVEHHLDFVMAISDRVIVLNLGRVIASGTPKEIRDDPQVATAYLGEDVKSPEASSDA